MKRRMVFAATIVFLVLTPFALRSYMQTNSQTVLPLARFAPRGALAYAEFPDAGDLLRRWEASQARERYFESTNWKQFQESWLYLKWRDRVKPIEAGLGLEITEDQFAKFVGVRSALAVYNIGELEALFITEMSRSQGLSAVLFEQSADFKERSVDGQLYYVREGADDEGRRKTSVGFAFADGKLFVASSETLLHRALTNVKDNSDDRLWQQIAPLVESLDDFRPHELTVWLDQQRLNADRYFANYWIHRNPAELETIESALIDLEIAGNEFRERRWFALKTESQQDQRVISSLGEMLRVAPADAHLLTVTAPGDVHAVGRTVAQLLLGASPNRVSSSPASVLYEAGYESAWRESGSQDHFNQEIDDPTSFIGPRAERAKPSEAGFDSDEQFVTRLANLLQSSEPQEVMTGGEAVRDANQFFVSFNRALVIRLARPDAFARQELEDSVREEFTRRYVVAGTPHRFEWKVLADVHSLDQSLVDRGAAYAVVGSYLILANRGDYCARLVQAYKESRASSRGQVASLERFAQVRIEPGKETYKHLMEILAVPPVAFGSNEAMDVFSDTIAGLIGVVPDLSGMTVETVRAG